MSSPDSSDKSSASSLIVISNRLPVNLKRSEQGEWKFDVSSGGLVAALCGLKMSNFTWVGWPGCDVKQKERDYVTKELAKLSISCVPVWLDDKLADKHYNGFSNSVLWPLFHYLEDIQFDDELYEAYKEVNYRFAQVVSSIYKKGDLVWVHDYHLMLMPRILRKHFNPNLPMGFFLHIPFPSSEIYRIFPNGRALLKGVLSCDLVGFHTWEYCRHFMKTATRILGVERLPNAVRFNNQTVPVGVFPVGIDPSKFSEMLEKPEVLERVKGLRETFGNKKVLLGVDRLDYIKGVPHKLWGYEMFLQQHPEWLGKVVLLQVAVPSRTDVEEYVKLKEEVEELVGRINSRFGDVDFNPVHYMFRSVNFAELCAMYRVADGLLITSLRDGMNLVCQEYVVSQDYQDPGLLVLSEFAGAAGALSGSYRVNPWNSGEVAEAIYQAVSMPLEQRRARFQEDIHGFIVILLLIGASALLLNLKSQLR
jgi:alpha,alpha-trehalose-phosphate synthase [UDP-forming]